MSSRICGTLCIFVCSFAAVSCGDSSGPPGLTLKDAAALAADLEAVDHAVASTPLRSLSSLAIPINRGGIDVHNMSTSLLGKSLEWNGVQREVLFTDRAGAPAEAIRVYLYVTDSTNRPAYPPAEIGYADLYPYNTYNGGGPDSISLRFVVYDARPLSGPVVVGDFLAHSHADTSCQCATVEGWVSDGTTRVDFTVPYNIPLGLDGQFPGSFMAPGVAFDHFATLPGPGVSTSTAKLTMAFAGDSITTTSGLLRPHANRLEGQATLAINGVYYATVSRTATGSVTATGPNGRSMTSDETRAVSALFAVPADIAYYIEWPTFVVFFCGC
ncbi:MAG: hypothetical protein ABR537_00565 [Gemmatimonadales bacterium]